ncbi:acyltransferase [Lactobacillus sp. LC28-10]|uniref:Acyltransferase n=1 Tax=Secundilactobacillus angelensis TaxID=2722706 RepID=A0ABX1KYH5_9LACO|nr:acyltransferase [Secundilactobacillus angelensis]MCH5462502.1 acyltransferase [Secundilactobacillus angelensis]NLR18307.1 acyltransferase [Secundilactobacillus angelensis]
MSETKSVRNYGIDLIKIIACLGVIGLHVFGDANFQTNSDLANQILYYAGTPAIPLFFMANGYFVLNKKRISFAYSFKKIRTLIFVVVSWGLLMFCAETIIKSNGNFVLNVFGGLIQVGHLYHFWFLGSLMILYMLAPILSWLMNKSVHFLPIAIICLTLICFGTDIFSHLEGYPVQSNVIQTFRFWTWLDFYMIGCGIKRIDFENFIHKTMLFAVSVTSFILLIIYSIFNKVLIHNHYAEFNYDNILTFIFCIALFISLSVYFKSEARESRNIEFLSGITMAIYIIHPFVIMVLQKVLEIHGGNLLILLFVVVVGFVTIIASLMVRIPIVKHMVTT